MMCAFFLLFTFFVSVYTTSSRNNVLIYNFSILLDKKVNIVGAFGGQNLKFLIVFKSAGKRKEKLRKNEFLRKMV